MAEISTDVSSELNITARRGDTFILDLEVKDPDFSTDADTDNDGLVTLDMTGAQYTGSDGSTPSTTTQNKRYGIKMTIADSASGDAKLTIFTTYYADQAFSSSNNVLPTATVAGEFYGSDINNPVIDLSPTSSEEGKIKIKIPASYMVFEAGTYNYDLQVRKKLYENLDSEITTWLRGTFTLNADITAGTS